MAKQNVFYKLPDGNFIKKEKSFKTTYLQSKDSGRMIGRKKVKGKGDGTGVRRVKKDFVLVRRSKRAKGHVRRKYYAGQIIGRT